MTEPERAHSGVGAVLQGWLQWRRLPRGGSAGQAGRWPSQGGLSTLCRLMTVPGGTVHALQADDGPGRDCLSPWPGPRPRFVRHGWLRGWNGCSSCMGFFPLNPSLSAGPEGTGHSQEKTCTYPQETLFSADPEEALLSVHIVFSLTPLSGPWGCFQSTDRKYGLFLGSLPHCWSKPMNTIHLFVFSLLSYIQSLCSTLQFLRKRCGP